jgi:hypothetical protein
VIDEVHQRDARKQHRHAARDPNRPRCSCELLSRPPGAPPEASKAREEAVGLSWHGFCGQSRN